LVGGPCNLGSNTTRGAELGTKMILR